MEENNETTTELEAPAADSAPTPEPTEEDPSVIGHLTPEEQAALMKIRAESQQLLAKCGEYELLKLRVMARVEELDEQGQGLIAGVTKRLGLPPGSTWQGMQDGTIRLVNKAAPDQNQGGGAPAS